VVGLQNANIADTLQGCHGNQFWDYISCRWTLTADNEMRISCEGRFVFSKPPRLIGRSLWIRSCGDRNCSRRVIISLGIDTLISNILVKFPTHSPGGAMLTLSSYNGSKLHTGAKSAGYDCFVISSVGHGAFIELYSLIHQSTT